MKFAQFGRDSSVLVGEVTRSGLLGSILYPIQFYTPHRKSSGTPLPSPWKCGSFVDIYCANIGQTAIRTTDIHRLVGGSYSSLFSILALRLIDSTHGVLDSSPARNILAGKPHIAIPPKQELNARKIKQRTEQSAELT